jgi:hypothetical protein
MTTKNWLLTLFAVVLGTVYVIYFTDWLKPKTVVIFSTCRQMPARLPHAKVTAVTIFGLKQPLRLTEIKVVPLAVWQTNKNVLPLWHLISTSNSVPVKMFSYGQHIGGLKPAIPGDRPEPLETNIVYRLIVTAGRITGQHDFEADGKRPEAP